MKKVGDLESKKISLVIVFAALSIILNSRFPGLVIPSFFPGLWFYFWEIPIVIALLLLGLRYAVSIALINGVILFAVFSGPGFNNPAANLLASITTLFGVYLAKKLIIDRYSKKQRISKPKETIISTGFAMLIRVLIMIPFVFLVFRLLTTISNEVILAFLPLLALFDAVIVAYTVPVAYFIETKIRNRVM